MSPPVGVLLVKMSVGPKRQKTTPEAAAAIKRDNQPSTERFLKLKKRLRWEAETSSRACPGSDIGHHVGTPERIRGIA